MRRVCRTSGQSLVETIIALTLLMTMILGLIHLSFLAVTRLVCNLAAFEAARASVYSGAGDYPRAYETARSITSMLPAGTRLMLAVPQQDTFRVQVHSPFGYPLTGPGGRAIVASEAPMYTQPDIPEVGDNARR
ncbi:MAG: pilus assembly protein [Acidobacteria bacterium]|nr:pilus assembly protein [Acidobacteriota bacterium]